VPILHATEVTPLPGYRLALRFNNGESGTVDLSGELEGEVFEPLILKVVRGKVRHECCRP